MKNPNHNPIQNRRFEDFVGLGPQLYTQYKPGMQVLIFRKCPPTLESADDAADGGGVKKKSAAAARRGKSKKKKPQQEKSEEEKELEKLQRSTVFSGDYVRLLHREQGGHIICRPDDGEAYLSVVTPLGSIMRKRNMMNQHNTHGIFVRSQVSDLVRCCCSLSFFAISSPLLEPREPVTPLYTPVFVYEGVQYVFTRFASVIVFTFVAFTLIRWSQLAQHPLEPHDFPCTLSSLGIWQVRRVEYTNTTAASLTLCDNSARCF